jgi:hypothetical protein
MKRIILATVVLGALALPLLALASHIVVHDPNDTRGRLDVRRVEVHRKWRPRWTVVTWSGWRVRAIFDRGYVLVRLDTFHTERFDYYALVRSIGSRMKATLFRDRRWRSDIPLGPLPVSRPDRSSVKVPIRLSKLRFGRSRRYYRWTVETIFTNRSCPNTCFDHAPNRGAIKEPRPGVSPAPTPTPTVSPTPSPTSTP